MCTQREIIHKHVLQHKAVGISINGLISVVDILPTTLKEHVKLYSC